MAGIFDKIFRYRQSSDRKPREDYFTELFAFFLEKCGELGVTIVGKLISRNNITDVEIQTQQHFSPPPRRVDMCITSRDETGGKHVLIVESKLESTARENQLSDYVDLLAQRFGDADSKTLVYITKRSEDPDELTLNDRDPNVRFRYKKWSHIYAWIKEYAKTLDEHNVTENKFLSELLTLMEDWNMGGEINAYLMRAAFIFHNYLNSGDRLSEEIVDPAWTDSGIGNVLGETNGNWVYRYGRTGWQISPSLTNFGNVRIAMGFRYDRRDEVWNVDEMELPSAAVTVVGEDINDFVRPSDEWKKGPVEGMGANDLWVREIEERPLHGAPLNEFYSDFFLQAFGDLHHVLAANNQ